MKHPFAQIRMLAAGALVAMALVACGGGSSSPSSPPPPPPPPPVATGTVSVATTNLNACDFAALNLTISKLRFSTVSPIPPITGPVDPGWVDVPVSQPRKIDVANLTNGALEVLGQATLEVGHYRQLALVFDTNGMANTVVPSPGDGEQAVEVPGTLQSGLVVYADFDVVAGQKTDILFDSNACNLLGKSADGQYTLNAPGMAPVPNAASNGITGFISPAALPNHVLVTAQFQGRIIASTRPDPATGKFWLSHLTAGDYDVVITTDNSAASVIGGVPVGETDTTAISTGESPILLASSKMGSISGGFTFEYLRSPVYISAMQVFTSGAYPTTIRYKAADTGTDTYTVSNLPLAAPLYAQYTSTLPLAFGASSIATPGTYIVKATAGGLPGFATVDISTGDKTGVNFNLIPSGP